MQKRHGFNFYPKKVETVLGISRQTDLSVKRLRYHHHGIYLFNSCIDQIQKGK